MTRLVVNNSLARRAFSRSITVAPGAQEMPIPQQSLTEIAASLQSMADRLLAMKNDQSSTVQTIKDIQTMNEHMSKQMYDTIFYNPSVEVALNDLWYTHDKAKNLYTFYLSADPDYPNDPNKNAYGAWSTKFAGLFNGHPKGSFKELLTRIENINYTEYGRMLLLIGSTSPHISYAKLDDKDKYVDANMDNADYLSVEILHINEGATVHLDSKPQDYSNCVVLSLVLAKDGTNTWKAVESTDKLSYVKDIQDPETGIKTYYDCLIKRGGIPEGAKSITAILPTICKSWCAGVTDTSAPVKLKYTSSLK